MKTLSFILILIAFSTSIKVSNHPEAKLEIMDYCRHFNYPVESHKVIT